MNFLIQEAQMIPTRMYSERPTPRHLIIKLQKVIEKEIILKGAREKSNSSHSRGLPLDY